MLKIIDMTSNFKSRVRFSIDQEIYYLWIYFILICLILILTCLPEKTNLTIENRVNKNIIKNHIIQKFSLIT